MYNYIEILYSFRLILCVSWYVSPSFFIYFITFYIASVEIFLVLCVFFFLLSFQYLKIMQSFIPLQVIRCFLSFFRIFSEFNVNICLQNQEMWNVKNPQTTQTSDTDKIITKFWAIKNIWVNLINDVFFCCLYFRVRVYCCRLFFYRKYFKSINKNVMALRSQYQNQDLETYA